MADIFVSYTSSDRDWAFWIGKELEALGHVPHIHEWEIKGGDDIYGWMETRLDTADFVLCVVSDQYLKAPYSTLERHAALWQAASNRPGFVLFVVVKPCKLPVLSDHFLRCELYNVADDSARQRFHEFMTRPQPSGKARFPGELFAVSNITIRVPEHFLGRDDSLARVEKSLKRYGDRVAITVVHGLRGVGKTVLAATYAEKQRRGYRATWWIRAQAKPSMRADLAALGVRLSWIEPDTKEEEALAEVKQRLGNEGEGILLIYDNAIDVVSLNPYLPAGGAAQILVTSNSPAWRKVADPIELALWPKEIGADYFIARTGRSAERAAAEALSEALGGLPLAHEQAAAYCERTGISLAEYKRRFEAAPGLLLDANKDAPAEYHGGLTVAKTFALAIHEAAKLFSAAEPLIVHAALLTPEPIPLYFFLEAREKFGEPLSSTLADDGLDEAVAALRNFALVEREMVPDERDPAITTDCIRLHRLVREVAAARAAGDAREDILRALVGAMVAVYLNEVFSDPKAWPRARRLDALALALCSGDEGPRKGSERNCAYLLSQLGLYKLGALRDYGQAQPLLEQALAIEEKMRGAEHPYTASSLNNLALLLKSQGDYEGARPLYERALAIREKVLGTEHPDTAISLNNLAVLLGSQGDHEGARPLHERALAIREKVLGAEHPDTAQSLNNLAELLRVQGDYEGARPLYKRALAVWEKTLGAEHPSMATSLNNLAELLRVQGDNEEAQPLHERALAIREKVLGAEHPDTAQSLNNLAFLLQSQGNYEGARPLIERALVIFEKVLGPEHRDTKVCAALSANLLDALGRADEAAALRARFGLPPEPKPSA
jgi:tetratricopeptide (TPR) repeat protein